MDPRLMFADPSMTADTFGSDILIVGDGNSPPLVSDTPETSQGSTWSTVRDIFGNLGKTARDLGSAVGTIQRDIKGAPAQYTAARQGAVQSNALSQWWQYATTQDKIMVGLAIAGIAVVLIRR